MNQARQLSEKIRKDFEAGKPIDDAVLRAVRKAVPARKKRKAGKAGKAK